MTKEEEYIGMNDAVFYYVSGDEYCKIPETISLDDERCEDGGDGMSDFAEDTNVPTNDYISRQAVKEILLTEWIKLFPMDLDPLLSLAMVKIENIPSAEPEPLTDKEQRIFLAAMGREEKVCKQVDAECRDCRKPYKDSLVRTCHEIIRKVKGALWT